MAEMPLYPPAPRAGLTGKTDRCSKQDRRKNMVTKMKSFSRRGGGGVDEGSGPLGRSRGENVYQNQSQTICMSHGEGGKHHPAMLILLGIALLTLLLSACSGPSSSNPSSTNNTTRGGTN